MNTNKIGEKVALFWIAWGFIAEKAENFKLADQVLFYSLNRSLCHIYIYYLHSLRSMLYRLLYAH